MLSNYYACVSKKPFTKSEQFFGEKDKVKEVHLTNFDNIDTATNKEMEVVGKVNKLQGKKNNQKGTKPNGNKAWDQNNEDGTLPRYLKQSSVDSYLNEVYNINH
jgi:hypothetical protein